MSSLSVPPLYTPHQLLVITPFLLVLCTIGFILALYLFKKQKKNWTKRSKVIFLLVITLTYSFISIGALICYFYPEGQGFPNSYSITVTTNSSNTYFLYAPAPLNDSSGNVSDMVNFFVPTSGNVNVSVVNTTYGMALNFSAIGSFSMKALMDYEENVFDNASLKNMSIPNTYLIHYNSSTGDSIDLSIWGHSPPRKDRSNSFYIIEEINYTGWNNVEGYWLPIYT